MNLRILLLIIFMLPNVVFPQLRQAASPVSEPAVLRTFLQMAMQYPEPELSGNIQGKVKVLFTVNANGESDNFSVEKSVNPALDNEAIRLVRKIIWKPAIVNGVKVKSEQAFTVNFKKSHYHKAIKSRGYDRLETLDLPKDYSGIIYLNNSLDETAVPTINGGMSGLSRYIAEQMKYPDAARYAAIEGTVKLAFVVEEDGIPSNISVEQSVGGGCDQEAIRILQTILWKPATKNGMNVRSKNSVDISFKLSDRKQQNIPNRNNTGL